MAGVLAYASVEDHGNPYGAYQFATGVTCVGVGVFVARRRPHHPIGFVLLAAGAGSWMTFAGSSALDWLFQRHPGQELLGRAILHSGTWGWIVGRYALAVLAPFAYPHGWSHSRWTRLSAWAASVVIAVTAASHSRLYTFEYFEGQPPAGTAKLAERTLTWGHRLLWVMAAASLVTMCVRVLRLPASERGRHLPFAGVLMILILPILNSIYSEAFGGGVSLVDNIELWAMIVLPLVLAGGIVLARDLDIDVALRRATTYGVLVAMAAAAYVAVVWVSSLFVQGGAGVGPALATGVIAVGIVPIHAWTERVVARHLFGNRSNPYAVIAAMGDKLEHAPPGDRVLQLVVDTVGEQLRLPFVAVEVTAGDTTVEAARWGTPGPAVESLPLEFHGEHLGALVVGQRTDREPFHPSERDLLRTLARQCGVLAHNASLTEALRRSHAVLVQAREAERLRIRRDLHDGLGPTLATVSLSLGAAAERLHEDPELAALLRDLEGEIRDSISDIRRLVYDLRPPALDELGLVDAIRGEADRLGAHGHGLTIDISSNADGPAVAGPVELAAYRIAVEAMTNTARHAHASWCNVAIEKNHQLVVRVEDDGEGVSPDATPGLGFRSMRERVAELGGSLRVAPRQPCGTVVVAALPLEELR